MFPSNVFLGRVHTAIPEQWSDINLFRHSFADISVPVHIEKSYVGWKLTSGHNYVADIVREMASQTVMWCAGQVPSNNDHHRRRISFCIIVGAAGLLSFSATLSYFFLCHRMHNGCTTLSVHVDANLWASCSKNSGERFKWRFWV